MKAGKKAKLAELPLNIDIETKTVLKSLPSAHSALAELKGIVSTIPNQNILINTLGLQEAKDSSAIENIITTHDDLYKSELNLNSFKSLNAKEVQNYIAAMKKGFELTSKSGLLTNKIILQIQEELEGNKAGFRKLPGTTLVNAATGQTIYTPPQNPEEIKHLMTNLEKFINNRELCSFDPLVKMAIIHYQFERIHPFYDGNGRTGRIINILYLILEKLQNLWTIYRRSGMGELSQPRSAKEVALKIWPFEICSRIKYIENANTSADEKCQFQQPVGKQPGRPAEQNH